MNNSRWMASRIGLVDFWYYGDQEYEFLDGRMLLRGANGSGKSVTMQSFIPLLLDGNMRPERLDPFGSRARKMDNYLLEEEDTREERTGYLYMEFRRETSETYLTFGMGIRARKGKKLETWYFYIQDGRRVGRDFLLYKEGMEKLVLTKTELKNRIGTGGEVMDAQGEYEACVNRLLFGFETVEEYRELLSLLIQLRTPKLSKDFKPSVINEILSKSLQTLSEDDLRPMSEAIENMDSIETNLRMLSDCAKAAKDIQTVYDKYNRAVLLEKAENYIGAEQTYKKDQKETAVLEERQKSREQELLQVRERYAALENEQRVVEEEYRSLKDSDAAKLKEQEQELVEEEAEKRQLLQEKEEKLESKKGDLREKEIQLQEHTDQSENLWYEIGQCFEEIAETMEESAFSEWQFMIRELEENKEEAYDFDYQAGVLRDYGKRIREGIRVLEKEEDTKKKYGDAMQEMDRRKDARESREKEWQQYEGLVREQKGELIEAIHVWSEQNEQIHLDPLTLQQMDRLADAFGYEDDYSEIRGLADQKRQEIRNELADQKSESDRERRRLDEENERLSQEIRKLEQAEEVEPERPEAVVRNRKLLQEQGIPVLPFYKTIDFASGLTAEQSSRLEAALYEMGILDALVVSPDDRERILSLDENVCDRYLFTDAGHLQANLMELFQTEHAEHDIVLTMQIQNLLSGIGYGMNGDSATWIDEKGHYRIGIVEGTVSSDYEAKFVGTTAREKHRLACIEALRQEKQTVEQELDRRMDEIRAIERKLEQLQKEFDAFPAVVDLREALKGAEGARHLLEQAEEDVRRQREVLREWEQKLKEIQIQVQEICGKTGLPERLSAYEEEQERVEEYGQQFGTVKEKHGQYVTTLILMRDRQDQIHNLSMDLDDLMSEQNRLRWQLDKCAASLHSVREQMKLTNYEEIRERLDHCAKRLSAREGIPKEKEEASLRRGELEAEIKNGAAQMEKAVSTMLRSDAVRKQWMLVFAEEYKLGYVEAEFVPNEDMYDMACQVQAMIDGQLGTKTRFALFEDLQSVYHEKRGILTEYQLIIQNNMFAEQVRSDLVQLPEDKVTRIDIRAKYRGVEIPFLKLASKLRADVEELSNILSEKDRELFEDILSNTISKKIRIKIQESNRWVDQMNRMMESMETSSGLTLSLKWKPKTAEQEGQLDTGELVELLRTDAEIMRQEDIDKISGHFRACIREARKLSREEYNLQSFHMIMKEILDYRKWFEFQLYFQKAGEKKKVMTDRMFFTFSGGEKAMSMYVPLFSAVVAKYKGANDDAPRIISLDEAFAGVDEMNIKDMFRLMIQLELNFIINSQVLWGDYDTVPGLAIFHLLRPQNAKYVTVMKYIWNGKVRTLV